MQNQQPILNAGENFELTLLAGSNPMGAGSVVHMVGPFLRAQVSMNLPFGSAVKVECGGLLLLGDVCHCEPKDNGYIATITARHVTSGIAGLQNLGRALREYQAAGTPEAVDEPVQETTAEESVEEHARTAR